jgi:hypothetical protein
MNLVTPKAMTKLKLLFTHQVLRDQLKLDFSCNAKNAMNLVTLEVAKL